MSDRGLLSFLNPLLMTVIAIPHQLYVLYVDYLWSPLPNSYVSKVSSSMYILAIMMITPFVLLTLLDIASYVIARTLGVIDSTKASTNDKRILKGPIVQVVDVDSQVHPICEMQNKSVPSDGHSSLDDEANSRKRTESPALFVFSPSEGNLHISPSTIFTPPTSRPSSPPNDLPLASGTKSNSSSTISDTESFIMINSKDKLETTALRHRDINIGLFNN